MSVANVVLRIAVANVVLRIAVEKCAEKPSSDPTDVVLYQLSYRGKLSAVHLDVDSMKQNISAKDALCQFLHSVQPDDNGRIGIDAVYDALPLLQDHMDCEGLELVPDLLDDLSKGDISAVDFMRFMHSIEIPAESRIAVTIKHRGKGKKQPRSNDIDKFTEISLKEYRDTNILPLYSAAARCYGRLPSSEKHFRRTSFMLKVVNDPSPYAQPIEIDHLNSSFKRADKSLINRCSMKNKCLGEKTSGHVRKTSSFGKIKSTMSSSRIQESPYNESVKRASAIYKVKSTTPSASTSSSFSSNNYSVQSKCQSNQSRLGGPLLRKSKGLTKNTTRCTTSTRSESETSSHCASQSTNGRDKAGLVKRRVNATIKACELDHTTDCDRFEGNTTARTMYPSKNNKSQSRPKKREVAVEHQVIYSDDSFESDTSQSDADTSKVSDQLEYVRCSQWPSCKKAARVFTISKKGQYKAQRQKCARQPMSKYKNHPNDADRNAKQRTIPKGAFDKSQIVFKALHLIGQMNRSSYKTVCKELCEAAADEYHRMSRYYRALRNMIIWCRNYSQWVGQSGTAWNFRLCYITYFPFCGRQIFPSRTVWTPNFGSANRGRCATEQHPLNFSKTTVPPSTRVS